MRALIVAEFRMALSRLRPHAPRDSATSAMADLFNSVPKHVAPHRPTTLARTVMRWRDTFATRYAR